MKGGVRFGAADLAPPFWRRRFGAGLSGAGLFGRASIKTIWRRTPIKTIWRHTKFVTN